MIPQMNQIFNKTHNSQVQPVEEEETTVMKHKHDPNSKIWSNTRRQWGMLLILAGLLVTMAWTVTDHPSLERLFTVLFDLSCVFLLA
jgi:hypothetical protein